MHRRTRFSSVIAALALVLGTFVMVVGTASTATADTYDPPAGARMNNPHGSAAERNRIREHIIRSIKSVPKGSLIRVFSWNIRDKYLTDVLINQHVYKGVTVRVIMQDKNAYAHEPDPRNPIAAPGEANPEFWRLKAALSRYGNSSRPVAKRSWAMLCKDSCRGGAGIAHTKMILFSQVNHYPHVVMYGSGNLTTAAAGIQWNDLQTIVKNKALYDFAGKIFAESTLDRRQANAYRGFLSGNVKLMFFPYFGAGTNGDPIMNALAPVRCVGAAAGYGTESGRTIIRVSQTAIGDSRGKRVAWRLRQLKNAGCNVKVLYGLIGPEVKSILRGGGVPIHQLATDVDGDLIYDRYLHQKALTINGKYGANPKTALVWNGSANLQDYTMRSDEVLGRINNYGIALFYQRFVDQWFGRTARYARTSNGGYTTSSKYATDTYSDNVDEDLARRKGIDPYAKFTD